MLRAALAILIGLHLFGCKVRQSQPVPAPPADPATMAMVRQEFLKNNPDAIVGFVTEALAQRNWVAVSDVPLGAFREGQVMVFMNARMQSLGSGVVRRVTGTALHVECNPKSAARPITVGDLAVRFK
jgi:hypothetical protein